MASKHNIANNWIQADFNVDTNHNEDAADYLVKLMNNFAPRTSVKEGTTVRIKHVEMSEDLFVRFLNLHSRFPAFRIKKYNTPTVRNAIGVLCGLTVIANNAIPNMLRFQYTDVQSRENESLPDPFYISSPKVQLSPILLG